jgi:hypothetical protein
VFARLLRATAEDPDDARRRWEEVAGDAAEQDAAAFRARYRLP